MLNKVEHIGIAVKNLDAANELFEKLSEAGLLKIEEVEREGVRTSFFQVGNSKIEFLEALNPDSPIAKFIEKNGEGVHHIAFEVEDIAQEMTRLREAGFELLSGEPKEGADNKLICFLHPRSTNKVLIELC
ncbi:MAG: methylmalonyl-CoA epimerase, partial [Bacteroidota bacterium]|nr:methylmalonyl-CoA epimerase [Bacteroidota bacterium]